MHARKGLLNSALRWLNLLALGAVVFVLIYTVLSNKANVTEHRNRNEAVHQELESYIRCILLLRYAEPPISSQSTKQEVETALDKCATDRNNAKGIRKEPSH